MTAITSIWNKNSKQKRRGANQALWITSKQMCTINLLSDGIPDGISHSNPYTISVTISDSHAKNISKRTAAIPEANSDHSHCRTLLQDGRLRQWLFEAVGEHLSSQYLAQVDLSVSSHICSKIVLGCNVCNCSSTVDSFLHTRDQWHWIREHMKDSRDAELVQEMQYRCESHAAYSKGIGFSLGRGLGSRLLISWSAIDRSSESYD